MIEFDHDDISCIDCVLKPLAVAVAAAVLLMSDDRLCLAKEASGH